MNQIERVLIVDDDEISIFLTRRVLKNLGIGGTIQTANNGVDGLRIVKDMIRQGQPPQLILLDIKMPVMDGFAFLEELEKLENADFSHTKIVLLSSSQNPWEKERAKKHKTTAFLHKPLAKEDMQRILG